MSTSQMVGRDAARHVLRLSEERFDNLVAIRVFVPLGGCFHLPTLRRNLRLARKIERDAARKIAVIHDEKCRLLASIGTPSTLKMEERI
ncbi:hypothetical protein NS226_17815 [Aureimonas ureilytica]|uniref:Uncharacterized protein n=1 Tax=Aureimonas ureilytica TaxID=401562 RepID=A0A175R5G2_9HYPH|nr:hypothetical protein NS226_17815 [Aureimonas ureilytica]